MVAVLIQRPSVVTWLAAAVLALGCAPSGGATPGLDAAVVELAAAERPVGAKPVANAPTCPPFSEVAGPPPGVDPKHLTLEYWLEQAKGQYELDQVLLTPEQVAVFNAALQVPRGEGYHARLDLLEPLVVAELEREVGERRTWAQGKLGSGEYVHADGSRFTQAELGSLNVELTLGQAAPELRVALADAQIHCAPLADGFYTPALDLRLDRNACSALRAQDVVRVVAAWPNGMQLVQASYAFGWLAPDVRLSPPLPPRLASAFLHEPALEVQGGALSVSTPNAEVSIEPGTRLPAADARAGRAYIATATGFVQSSKKQQSLLFSTSRGLTRRAFFEEAWRFVGTPYGLGDAAGGRDCSRLVLEVFDSFGLHMPRHSSWQAQAGSFWVDVGAIAEAERVRLFDAAAKKGIVLLGFPGHIMLYLGRNERGEPMVLHGLGEFMQSCTAPNGASAGESLVRVKNIGVSNLELGRGTSRKALLERITRITVIGGTPGAELAGVAQLRPPAEPRIPADRQCRDSEQAALYVMPEAPNREQPLRIVAALNEDPGSARLTLIDPEGQRVDPDLVRLGGPPYGQVATVLSPARGRWKAIVADGDNVLACQRILVGGRRPRPNEPDEGPIWAPKYRWNVANENLYSLWVERLFDYPLEDERVWPSLHPILRDAERNILFDYRGLDEDNDIKFAPDCADLPYVLRAYFAWKMRLPFGYRRCTRGRTGRPPNCDEPGAGDNLMSRLELPGKTGLMQPRGDVEAFSLFVNTRMRSAVHSSSGRTAPEDELSDLYPVPLTRRALRPGTVFSDPYGHLLVLADWIPQPANGSGILVGVDAQPDGTVGQRRFWRGTFLFDPDTTAGGAGFKAFRPRTFLEEPTQVELQVEGGPTTIARVGLLEAEENKELRRSRRFVPFSLQQYKGSTDDFYSTIEALINPRPLEPKATLRALVDAFGESVTRRVNSVDNGEKWRAQHEAEVVAMPEGDSIFLSSGPWEDFSTPSRDLRLLISIDTVLGFSKSVRAAPERFGLREGEVEAAAAELERLLASELGKRSVSYTRSDGSAQKLTLADVAARAPLFEIAYNPNDCSEVRWAAPPGSAEMASCQRHAPPEQREKMERYRHWFATRKRPPQ